MFQPDIKAALRTYRGVLAGSVAIVVFILLKLQPDWAEGIYGLVVYPFIRKVFDFSIGLLPFPAVYLVPIPLFVLVWRHFRTRKPIVHHFRSGLNFVGWAVALFYFLWGFNYARPDLSQRIDSHKTQVSDSMLIALGTYTVKSLNSLRTANVISALPNSSRPESILRAAVEQSVAQYGIELNTRSRARLLSPPGVLRKMGITGIYFPFTGEGLLEKSHPQPEKLFVMAHELAHSYGITDEGEANLVAYLACTNHDNSLIQYAGHLSMWEYLRGSLIRRNIAAVTEFEDRLSELVKADLEMLKAERNRFREWIPHLGEKVNDTYLKAQGIEAGVEAYNALPELYLQHQKGLTAH